MNTEHETKKEAPNDVLTEIEVTNCPDCGTEWEVVVTAHPRSRAPNTRRER